MSPDWIVVIWLCIAMPGGAEECGLRVLDGRWPTEFMCHQAAPVAIVTEVEDIEAGGWTVSRVRSWDCRGPSRAG